MNESTAIVCLDRFGVLELADKWLELAKSQRRDTSAQARDTALKDPSRIKDVIQIVEDNLDSVKEMVTSAKKVQEDVGQKKVWSGQLLTRAAETTSRL